MLRTGVGNRVMTPMLAGFLEREVISRLAGSLDADDARLRASLAGSQIGGLLLGRYVLKLPALVDTSNDELARRIGRTIQSYLAD